MITKAFPNYSQVEYQGILVKKLKIGHLEKDDGCGCEWFTFELPEDVLTGSMGYQISEIDGGVKLLR